MSLVEIMVFGFIEIRGIGVMVESIPNRDILLSGGLT